MKNAIEKALSYDPLTAAEEATGKSYKTDEATSGLGMLLHMDHGAHKKTVLQAAGDTHFSQTIPEFLAFLRGNGFDQLLIEDIPGGEDNKYRIFWRDGVLVSFDSYWGDKSVNGGTAYFCFEGPRNAMFQCSNGWIDGTEPPVWRGSFDVREGFKFRLDRMAAEGKILPKWPKREWLWLLHYMDSKTPGYDHEAITASCIAKLPAHVQEAVRGN